MENNLKVDQFILKTKKWENELKALRKLFLDANLEEEFKWGKPCYSFNNHNIIIFLPLKNYCAIMFFKGSLLIDKTKDLYQPTENSEAQRQMRFSNLEEIKEKELILKDFITQAIHNEKEGIKVNFTKSNEIPIELETMFLQIPELKKAFFELTPGRQKGYILYFKEAKQEKTRYARIEKHIEKIMQRKGLND